MKRVLIAAVAVLSLSGCASIMEAGGTQEIKINSVPEGAAISVFDKEGVVAHTGRTPLVLEMERSHGYFDPESYTLLIRKKGYKPQTITLESIPAGWYVGNLFIGGLLGMLVVDPYTGGIYRLEPDEATKANKNVKFDTPAGTQIPSTLTIMLVEDLPPAQQAQLQPIK